MSTKSVSEEIFGTQRRFGCQGSRWSTPAGVFAGVDHLLPLCTDLKAHLLSKVCSPIYVCLQSEDSIYECFFFIYSNIYSAGIIFGRGEW